METKHQKPENNKPFSANEIYAVAGFFGFILGLLIYTFFTPNYYEQNAPVKLEVKEGSSLSQVIDSLYSKDIIGNKFNMKVAAFLYGAEKSIKAGRYEIPNGLSYLDLVQLLVEGSPEEQILVTIPEGIWQYKLASLLKNDLGIDSAHFMQLSSDKKYLISLGIRADKLEGYLLPNTYYFYKDSDSEEVIHRLYNAMEALFDSTALRQMAKLNMNRHQILTLASIIEAETNIESEFKTISGVYHNRLKRGMLLQADPTVQYLIRHRKKPVVYLKDLEINSPYNTYIHNGLPPGPINNPGKDAITAALFPEHNDYYYFVADGTGGHKFSKTLSEHLKNVREYRAWQRKQKLNR